MAMKLRRRDDREIFGISFLDVISCAFGALLALVIIAKNGEEQIEWLDPLNNLEATDIQPQGLAIESELAKLRAQLTGLRNREAALNSRLEAATSDLKESSETIQAMKSVENPSIVIVWCIY
jgi:hypothetical protein